MPGPKIHPERSRSINAKKTRSLLATFRISFVAFALLPLLVYLYFSVNYRGDNTIFIPRVQFISITFILGFTWIFLFISLNNKLEKVSLLNSSLKKILFGKIDTKVVFDLTREQGEVAELAKSFEMIMLRLEDNIADLEKTKKSLQNVLIKVGHALSSVENFDLLVVLILETAVEALGADKAAIVIGDRGAYALKAAVGFDNAPEKEVLTLLMPLLGDSVLIKNEPPPAVRMPLVYREKIWGILIIAGLKKPGALFSNDDAQIISSLSMQLAVAFENAALNSDVEKTYFETMTALAMAVEAKDSYAHGHSSRVETYAVKIARAMQMSEKEVKDIADAAKLHDIGKIGISDSILNKPAGLSEEEREVVRRHPLIGESIIRPLKTFAHLFEPVRHHHEFLDGSGYPDQLKAADIPLITRILTVSDIFDALSTKRVYRDALNLDVCRTTMKEMVNDGKLDPEVVRVLFELVDAKEIAL